MVTLSNLNTATAQQVFDQVSKHLLKQNEKSLSGNDCVYRTEVDGKVLKCAAGCLISDDEYNSNFEHSTWEGIVGNFRLSNNHVDLITELQVLHDDYAVYEWKEELKNIAEIHNLKTNF